MKYTLRKYKIADAGDFYKYSNNPDIYKNMSSNFPKTLAECEHMVKGFSENDEINQCVRAIIINEEAVGCIGLFLGENGCASVAYWLGKPYWRKGIMSRVLNEFCLGAFEQYKINKIVAEPYAFNLGSRKTLEKAGFHLQSTSSGGVRELDKKFETILYLLKG